MQSCGKRVSYIYHVPSDADAETRNLIVENDHAVLEGDFVGTHIGEFAGIPATNKTVRVPLCVVCDPEEGKIKRGRIYYELPALLKQLE